MTRIEKVIEITIRDYCPVEFFDEGPDIDLGTVIERDYDGKTIGCRGISCEQCWNQEVEK